MVVRGTVLEQINIFIAQNDGNDEIYKMAISVFKILISQKNIFENPKFLKIFE